MNFLTLGEKNINETTTIQFLKMLTANSAATRSLVKERFSQAVVDVDVLETPPNNVFESKMRLEISKTLSRNRIKFDTIFQRLIAQGYLVYEVVMCLVEELFDDHACWEFFVILFALLEEMVKYDYQEACDDDKGEQFKEFLTNGYASQTARYVDHATKEWLNDHGGWLEFNNKFTDAQPWLENRLFGKFYSIISQNNY